jgi:hypothetical protein
LKGGGIALSPGEITGERKKTTGADGWARAISEGEGEKRVPLRCARVGRGPHAGLGQKGCPGLLSPFFCSAIFSFLFSVYF